jgi:glyoxylase-like metal-dependent hydrolase (beta-lactamase superfamily II)
VSGHGPPRYLTEPEPVRGTLLTVAPGIDRIVAGNAGAMTYWGTNTYVVTTRGGTAVIDPGPDDPTHIAAILAAVPRIDLILVTHHHRDHRGAVPALKAASGSAVYAGGPGDDPPFAPDTELKDGMSIHGLEAVHTPGHAPDHFCFGLGDGTLFSGDHVMGWASTSIFPPGGDMAVYIRSLELLRARGDRLLLPGHGPAITDPTPHIDLLLRNRLAREQAILAALHEGKSTASGLVNALYTLRDERLQRPAERTVLAHLIKLESEGQASCEGEWWSAVEQA